MATKIRVEFYGIPRQRAGVPEAVVSVPDPATLRHVISQLGKRFPDLAAECFDGDLLRREFVASIGGRQFTAEPDCRLTSEEPLLILSADAGG